eukprot:1140451-Pelagomonas_calceolata.AAC.1
MLPAPARPRTQTHIPLHAPPKPIPKLRQRHQLRALSAISLLHTPQRPDLLTGPLPRHALALFGPSRLALQRSPHTLSALLLQSLTAPPSRPCIAAPFLAGPRLTQTVQAGQVQGALALALLGQALAGLRNGKRTGGLDLQ